MNKQVQRYAEIKLQIRELEAELESIKTGVFTLVMAEDGEELSTDLGTFKISQGKKKWIYSEKLTQKESELKEAIKKAKRKEELDGTAELDAAPAQLVFIAKQLKS